MSSDRNWECKYCKYSLFPRCYSLLSELSRDPSQQSYVLSVMELTVQFNLGLMAADLTICHCRSWCGILKGVLLLCAVGLPAQMDYQRPHACAFSSPRLCHSR